MVIDSQQQFMSVQFSQMLDTEGTPANSTQAKIIKLLDELKKPGSKSGKKQSQQINSEVNKFKSTMIKKYENINEKISTVTGILSQVQRQANEMLNYKEMLKKKIEFEDNLKEIQNEMKQFYGRKQRQRKQLQKYLLDRMLRIKLLNGQHDQRIKYQINSIQTEFINKDVNRISNTNSRQKDTIQSKRMEFTQKIKMLKRAIEQDSAKNKQQKKKIKKNFLQICEKITNQIHNEQSATKQSFQLHSQTLQKLVISISQRIQS